MQEYAISKTLTKLNKNIFTFTCTEVSNIYTFNLEFLQICVNNISALTAFTELTFFNSNLALELFQPCVLS